MAGRGEGRGGGGLQGESSERNEMFKKCEKVKAFSVIKTEYEINSHSHSRKTTEKSQM